MAQGKIKVKTNVPLKNTKNKKPKGKATSRRANAPIQPKKKKFEESSKLKQMITKTVNKSLEADIRAIANDNNKILSEAQKAVVAHNSRTAPTAPALNKN
uniref:Uncharacterized protein n=1 Tax=Xenopsylla cheopis TaxID=163159 RepID=A0A6M2DS87_XENCH